MRGRRGLGMRIFEGVVVGEGVVDNLKVLRV